MRNLKRVLSLALALVMVLGMMVITTSAAKFTDAEEITYDTAVDVISAIGVINGFEAADGTFYFDGDKTLTREQGAAFVCYLLMGKAAADKLVGSGNFSDVAADRWSAGEIDYCANLGLIKGNPDGTFNPEGPLTSVGFGRMLLGALGYDGDIEGYTGENWATNIAADMIDIGLDVKDVAMDAQLTREQAAQMAYQALSETMVKYATKGTSVSINGVDIVTGASEAEAVYSDAASNQNIAGGTAVDGKYTLQFAEKYFPKLQLAAGSGDGMGRATWDWIYKDEKVTFITEVPDRTFVVTKLNRGSEYTVAEYIDKVLEKEYTYAVNPVQVLGGSGAATTTTLSLGDVVELYMDDTTVTQVNKVLVTEYSVAQLNAPVATKGSLEDEDLEIRVPGVCGYKAYTDIKGYEGLKKDDVVYYYVDADGVITMAKAEYFTGKLTSITADGKYVIGGTKYQTNGNITVTDLDSVPVYNTEYNYYLDNNGYVIFAEAVEEEESDYIVVQDFEPKTVTGVEGGTDIEARIVHMDGTTEIVTVSKVDNYGSTRAGDDYDLISSNDVDSTIEAYENDRFFTYVVNRGKYELTTVTSPVIAQSTKTDKAITTGATATDNIVVNDNTVFVVAKGTAGPAAYTYNVFTGKDNVPTIVDADYAYLTVNGVAKYVFVSDYEGSTTGGNNIFVLSTDLAGVGADKINNVNVSYDLYEVIMNGEATTVKVTGDAAFPSSTPATGLYAPTFDANGMISNLVASSLDKAPANGYALSGTTLVVAGSASTSYVCADDAVAYYVDFRGVVSKMTAAELAAKDDNDQVTVIVKGAAGAAAATVDYVIVEEVSDSNVGVTFKTFDGSAWTTVTPTDYALTIGSGTDGLCYMFLSGVNVDVEVKMGTTPVAVTEGTAYSWFTAGAGTYTITLTSVDKTTATYTLTVNP